MLNYWAGLAFLAYQDVLVKRRQEASLREMEEAASMLRSQGLAQEAAVLDADLKAQRAPKAAAPKPKGLGADPFADDEGNRFQRRQGREARKKRKKRQRK